MTVSIGKIVMDSALMRECDASRLCNTEGTTRKAHHRQTTDEIAKSHPSISLKDFIFSGCLFRDGSVYQFPRRGVLGTSIPLPGIA
jgi:hypothetical protein